MRKKRVLTNVGYKELSLQGLDLQGASLQGASLQGASLQGANLRRASLQGVYQQRIVSATLIKYLGTILLFLFLLPYIITALFRNVENSNEADQRAIEKIMDEDFIATDIYVEIVTAAGSERIPAEIYLVDKLSRTIEKGYEAETLKAQAILLRTALAEQLWNSTGTARGAVTVRDDDYGCGEVNEAYTEAVYITRGVILTYQDVPAKAPYFAVSNGMTRDAGETLGTSDYPYLQPAACSKDFMAEKFLSQKTMARSEFMSAWEKAAGKTLEDDFDISNFVVTKDSNDYVIQISYPGPAEQNLNLRRPARVNTAIEEVQLSGEQCRTIWGLDSACFEMEEENQHIKFTVRGVGHGLGMSQFAANEMAKTESDYVEILQYFFPETQLTKFE